MDALRRSARISKLDRKTNECIRGKMDAQDTILDDITRKQLIWYGYGPNAIGKNYDQLET
jgi:phosphate starvation-inducible protein PhoH